MTQLIKTLKFCVLDPDTRPYVFVLESQGIHHVIDHSGARFEMYAYPNSGTPVIDDVTLFVYYTHPPVSFDNSSEEHRREFERAISTVFCAIVQGAILCWPIVERKENKRREKWYELDAAKVLGGRALEHIHGEIFGSMGEYRRRCGTDVLRYGLHIYDNKGSGFEWTVREFLQSGMCSFPYATEICDGVAVDLSREGKLEWVGPGYEVDPSICDSLRIIVEQDDRAWLDSLVQFGIKNKLVAGAAESFALEKRTMPKDPRIVFVVHGRDERARRSVFEFLRCIGLNPLEWSEAVSLTQKASPYVGEILESAFGYAQAVVVVMTPDEEVRLRSDLAQATSNRAKDERSYQPRPNVLFEAGMAMGRHVDRTVLVEIGRIRPFSDIGGRHVVRMDGTVEKRKELAQRLKTAGCPVDLEGNDWMSAGNFGPVASKE